MAGVPLGRGEIYTGKEPYDDGNRDWSDVYTSQGRAIIPSKDQKLKAGNKQLPPTKLRENITLPTSDFRLLISRTMRQ